MTTNLRIALLGPLAIEHDADEIVLHAAKERAVLSLLALLHGSPVSYDLIIEALWGDRPPRSARKAIQVYVSNLRHMLPDEVIATTGAGYALRRAGVTTDVTQFEHFIAVGRQLRGSTDAGSSAAAVAGAIEAFSAALALWRGDPVPDLVVHPFGVAEASRLSELQRSVEDEVADLRLAKGEHALVVADLEIAVAAEPYRETRWAQLMLALYRSGRQVDALRAYEHIRRRLADELGHTPGHDLQRLESLILRHDPTLDLPAGVTQPQKRRLPVAANSFVGRASECEALGAQMTEARLVTVVGPGGCGKTRLALETVNAHTDRFDDVVFASLTSSAHGQVNREIAAAVGVIEEPGRALLDTLVGALGQRCLLIILDNCEHVLDEAALIAETLVSSCPSVSILATSREALRCPSEHRFALSTLASDAAVTLFVDRARATQPHLSFEHAAELTQRICRRLDCLPLALEIAAARLEAMTLSELSAGLDNPRSLRQGEARAVPRRHRTLWAAISWSYDLLDSSEQQLLRHLGVFSGGVCLPELAVSSGGMDPTSLIQKSLVIRTTDAAGQRLAVHETIHQFALESLANAHELDSARRSHASTYAILAETSAVNLRGPEQRRWIDRLDAERGNVAGALTWAQQASPTDTQAGALGLRLCLALWWYWFRTNQAVSGAAWLDAAIAADGSENAAALAAAGYLACYVGDLRAASAYVERALRAPGAEPASLGLALGVRSRIHLHRHESSAARAVAQTSEQYYLSAGDPWCIAWARRWRAVCTFDDGDHAEGQQLASDAIARFQELGDGWAEAGCLEQLARIALEQGAFATAYHRASESVGLYRAFGGFTGIEDPLLHLAEAAAHLGDVATAESSGLESLGLSLHHGYRWGALQAHRFLADLTTDPEAARHHARLGEQLAGELRAEGVESIVNPALMGAGANGSID